MKWKWLILPILTALGFIAWAQQVQDRRPYPVELDQLVGVTNVVQSQLNDLLIKAYARREVIAASVTTNYYAVVTNISLILVDNGGKSNMLVFPNPTNAVRADASGNAIATIWKVVPFGNSPVLLSNMSNLKFYGNRTYTAGTNRFIASSNVIDVVSGTGLYYVIEYDTE